MTTLIFSVKLQDIFSGIVLLYSTIVFTSVYASGCIVYTIKEEREKMQEKGDSGWFWNLFLCIVTKAKMQSPSERYGETGSCSCNWDEKMQE